MTDCKSVVNRSAEIDQTFDDLVCEISAKFEAGQTVDLEAIASEYPEHIDRLSKLLPTLQAMAELGHSDTALLVAPPESSEPTELRTGVLGDYRIVREVGRGGMGVVYEAEQISLGRKVALKVLPFAAMLDQRQLARFQNEARAAASLKHPNIVHVYSVGCERGVHYYAMEYVDGQTLAAVVEELRRASGKAPKQAADEPPPTVSQLTRRLCSGTPGPDVSDRLPACQPSKAGKMPAPPSPSAETKREVQARISTEGTPHQSREYFRSVAGLGVQAAGALEHAHQTGVVHRDIKPSNLMVDASGHLWVTDFGLAMVETGPDLTMTGDVLGTLRYMSPEQAEGGRRVLDHRTDVYSLGLTLYELLTLQAAFDGSGRQALLRRILQDEPIPPRRLNSAIPADLETIVLKAIAKNPAERYATAQALADDLKRFLEDKPIRAKRPALPERARKWARRHTAIVWSAAAMLVMAGLVAGGIAWTGYRRSVDLERSVAVHLAAARAFLEAGDFTQADGEVTQSRACLETARYGEGPLQAQVFSVSEQVSAKIRAQERFDQFQQLRQQVSALVWDYSPALKRQASESCLDALKLYRVLDTAHWQHEPAYQDLDKHQQEVVKESAAELLFLRARLEVKTASDEKALAAAHRVAVDALGRVETFRQPVAAGYLWMADSWEYLGEERLAEDARKLAESLPPATALDYFALGEFQHYQGQFEQALQSYSMALRCKPDHFLSLYGAGYALTCLYRHEAAEAMLTGAIAVNPHSGIAYIKRGETCMNEGKFDQARADFIKAAQLAPRSSTPYSSLGELLTREGHFGEALAMYNKALELSTDAGILVSRGMAYAELGEHDKAITDLSAAIEAASAATKRNPHGRYCWSVLARARFERAGIHERLGQREHALNDFRGAIEPLTKKIEIPPSGQQQRAWAYRQRGDCYRKLEQYDNALHDYDKTLELNPDSSYCYKRRALTYYHFHHYEKAAADVNKAVELNANDTSAHTWFGPLLADCPDQSFRDEIVKSATKAIGMIPGDPGAYSARGYIYSCLKQYDKALADYVKAIHLEGQETPASRRETARLYRSVGKIHRERAEHEKAEEAYLKAIGLCEDLAAEFPDQPADQTDLAHGHFGLGLLFAQTGRPGEAAEHYREALKLNPQSALMLNNLAWLLATCPDLQFRDPARAVELAKKAVELAPEKGGYGNTLGAAHYRAGDWDAAIDALQKSLELQGDNSFDFFFLAMAHWQLGHKDEARKWYDRAVEWMEENKPDDEELRRFRAEAEELMDITKTTEQKQGSETEAAKTTNEEPGAAGQEPAKLEPGGDKPPSS